MDTGKDFIGTAKNDLFLALDDSNNKKTLTLADSIDGGKGTDTLKIVTAKAIGNADFSDNTIKGIEIVDIKSTDTGLLTLDTTADEVKNNFKDLTDLYVNSGTTTAGGLKLTVNGTTNVTAITTHATDANASITVNGGKAVSATLNTAAKATIKGNALTTVTVKGGNANDIDNLGTDTPATSGAGETLKSVTLEGNSTSNTIAGNAIDTLTLKNQTATVTTTITNTKSTALTVNLNNVNSGTASEVKAGAKAETVTINSNGTVANTLILTAAAGKTLNITGAAAFTLDTATPPTIKDIVSTNTKGVTITDALGTDVKFTGGAGADIVKLTASFEKAITMGAGNDTVTYAAASTAEGKVGSVDAGADKDTIIMKSTEAGAASINDVFNTAFKNFEVLKVSDTLTGTINLDRINNVSEVELVDKNANIATINGLVSGGRVAFLAGDSVASTNALIVNLKNPTGTSDVLNLDLAVATGGVNFGKVTAAGVETINITAADINTTTGSAADIATLTLDAADAKSVVVSGNNGLNLINTGTNNKNITTFDASGVVANDIATTDTDANLKVTFTSVNTKIGETVTIIGGAGDDALTGTAQANDTIIGGKGKDTITYNGGKDSFTGGEGDDTFVVGAKGSTVDSVYLTIQDLTKGDSIDVIAITNPGTVAGTGTIGIVASLAIAKVTVASNATFSQALDAAANNTGASTPDTTPATAKSVLKWFQFENNTYLVVDNSAATTYQNGADSVIKITGLVDLSASAVTGADVITIG